jgi:hypothetical protein
MGLEAGHVAFPIESKAERGVEDGVGIEEQLGSVDGPVMGMGVGTVAARVVT